MTDKRICIMGYTGVGKTTAGEFLGKPVNISDILIELYAKVRGVATDEVRKARTNYMMRDALYLLGRGIEIVDPLYLIKKCLERSNIVCGVRTKGELLACQQTEMFDEYLWILRPGHKARPEDQLVAADLWTNYPPNHHATIDNNGTLDDLRKAVLEAVSEERKESNGTTE